MATEINKLKRPLIAKCLKCQYFWFTQSNLEKPTCPACKSHNTKIINEGTKKND